MDTARNGGHPDDEITHLWARAQQLEHALESRVVIEQAKGILSERYRIDLEEAFELLRRSARSQSLKVQVLAAEVTTSAETPTPIRRTLDQRARAG
jgi:AmiR/NasT family two-component response regulator